MKYVSVITLMSLEMQKFMGKLCFQGMHLFQTKNFIWQMASLKKYEIVKDNFKEIYGIKVYKIKALKDIKIDIRILKKVILVAMLNRKGTFRNMIIVEYTIMQLSLEMQKLFRVQMYANMLKYQIMRSS